MVAIGAAKGIIARLEKSTLVEIAALQDRHLVEVAAGKRALEWVRHHQRAEIRRDRRTVFYAAVDPARKVDAEERKASVGNRINQVAHQELALRPDEIVFAAKRNDANRALLSGELGYTIRVQSSAG